MKPGAPRDAWIATIPEVAAEGELARLYQRARDPETAAVDNILKVHGLHPRSLRDHLELYLTTMRGPGPLAVAEREMIAVVVSTINACHY